MGRLRNSRSYQRNEKTEGYGRMSCLSFYNNLFIYIKKIPMYQFKFQEMLLK